MSEIKVNKISPRTACGTTTLGDSGDTFNLPSGGTLTIAAGATITNNGTANNFGATGSVNWQTTVKTSGFTAVNGEGYFVDTSSGAISVNLPAGTAGAVVGFSDYAKNFDTAAVTLVQNGSDKIGGSANNATLSTEGLSVTLVYIDATKGWIVTDDGLQSSASTNPFIAATGGTISESGNCRIHTFTGPGTFVVSKAATCAANNVLSHLVVAGGGGSGGNRQHIQGGGGGGAGGFREVKSPVTPYTASPLDGYPSAPNRITVSAASYTVTIGGGGTAGTKSNNGDANATNGGNTTLGSITSAGGGRGAQPGSSSHPNTGSDGGSGGGGSYPGGAAGSGNSPTTSPAQGSNGGAGSPGGQALGGSGGGATGTGSTSPAPGTDPVASTGGAGAATSITTSPVTYSTGGDYSQYYPGGPPGLLPNAADNTGNGADAQPVGPSPSMPCASYDGHNGGSGIVVIRYKYQ